MSGTISHTVAADRLGVRRIVQIVSTSIVLGSMAATFALSFAAIVYAGPAAQFLSQGIALTLIGAIVMAAVGAMTLSYRGTLVQPQDVTAILLALCVASIAATPGLPAEATFATSVALIAATSVATGLAAIAMGAFKLGYLARFVPFPVIGGFLAASGALLIRGAFDMVAPGGGTDAGAWIAFMIDSWALWAPWLALGLAIVAATRLTDYSLVIPLALAAGLGIFYAWTWGTGIDFAAMREMGLLLGPFQGSSFITGLQPDLLGNVRWGLLFEQAPVVLTIVAISLLGTLLNASALEVAIDSEIDFERDLKGVGVSNIAAGLGGGMVGYHTLGDTFLARRFGVVGSGAGLGVAVVTAIVLFFGAEMLSYVPVGIFAAVIWFLGLDLLLTALWEHGRRMPAVDLLIVIATPVIALTFGFMPAVAFGVVVAALVFIVTYSGVDLARLSTTGANFHARVERPPADQALLAEMGGCVHVHRLQGYVFFGSASKLVDRLQRHLEGARFAIVDFRGVVGMDVSAWAAFERLTRNCRKHGTELHLTGLSPRLRERFARFGAGGGAALQFTLDDLLADIEERLLTERARTVDAADEEAGKGLVLPENLAALLRKYGYWMTLSAGDTLMAEGARSDHLVFLVEGRCRATAKDRNGETRAISRLLPGAMMGEIAYYAGVPRTATIIAETGATAVRLDADGMSRMEREDPAAAVSFHRMLAVVLARRLMTTTRLLNDAEL